MDSNKKAIIRTLLYSSLFSFPLRLDELYSYLLHDQALSHEAFQKALRSLSGHIVEKDGYYSLREYTNSIENRISMSEILAKKWKTAQKIAGILSFIPTIYFVGLSGGLAAGSARKSDDIDYFIITRKNTLFMTRILSLVLLQLLGKRRKFKEKNAKDKVCLNMWIDTSRLPFPSSEQDLYIAREIAQLKPLINRGTVYKDFLTANNWVTTYLPHAFTSYVAPLKIRRFFKLGEYFICLCEPLARGFQKILMGRHRTTEVILDNYLAFHPHDYRIQILQAFSKRLKLRAKIL